MFTTIIVRPIFNLLVLMYALIPGHNFGLAIILFTIVIRLLMWPLVKKQLHHAKAMRDLQPELKRIKQETKGNRQKESLMVMELYKERQINPFSSLGILIVQIPILFGLYAGLRRILANPQQLIDFSYGFIRHLGWMQTLAHNIHLFDHSLFGVVDLTRAATDKAGVYWPAMIIVLGSAVAQYYQSKQLLPQVDKSRNLRSILRDVNKGTPADQAEVNAAVGNSTRFLIPVMIFILTVGLASALSLYWLMSGLVAYWQQARVLKSDKTELEELADKKAGTKDDKTIIEGEVVPPKPKTKKPKKPSKTTKKRRKK